MPLPLLLAIGGAIFGGLQAAGQASRERLEANQRQAAIDEDILGVERRTRAQVEQIMREGAQTLGVQQVIAGKVGLASRAGLGASILEEAGGRAKRRSQSAIAGAGARTSFERFQGAQGGLLRADRANTLNAASATIRGLRSERRRLNAAANQSVFGAGLLGAASGFLSAGGASLLGGLGGGGATGPGPAPVNVTQATEVGRLFGGGGPLAGVPMATPAPLIGPNLTGNTTSGFFGPPGLYPGLSFNR